MDEMTVLIDIGSIHRACCDSMTSVYKEREHGLIPEMQSNNPSKRGNLYRSYSHQVLRMVKADDCGQ
jgi:hypothetical protein